MGIAERNAEQSNLVQRLEQLRAKYSDAVADSMLRFARAVRRDAFEDAANIADTMADEANRCCDDFGEAALRQLRDRLREAGKL